MPIDAQRPDVAFERLVRVPEVRRVAEGVLGTIYAARAGPEGIVERSAVPKGISNRNRIENSMFVETALTVPVQVRVIPSALPCPAIARVRT